jgi:Pyridoxamine 5'-phosphate oxidase
MDSATTLSPAIIAFIKAQPLFFVATAGAQGRVNVSPKGLESLRVLSSSRILWLNLSGSGNETAAHVRENGRMTLMFCAFHGPARILRIYGTAKTIHPRDAAWNKLVQNFPAMAGARQIFDLTVQSAQTSCGTGVPLMDFKAERGPEELLPFYADMPPGGVEAYWARKNSLSIDGKDTGIFGE